MDHEIGSTEDGLHSAMLAFAPAIGEGFGELIVFTVPCRRKIPRMPCSNHLVHPSYPVLTGSSNSALGQWSVHKSVPQCTSISTQIQQDYACNGAERELFL
jgi:hypothetical protein